MDLPLAQHHPADYLSMQSLADDLLARAPGDWKILLVDDDPTSRSAMAEWLELKGYHPLLAGSAEEARRRIQEGVAVVVTDLKLPGTSGLELLRELREKAPQVPVILVSGHGTVDTAVTALKEGAFDFLTKPINLRELAHRIQRAIENRALTAEVAKLHAELHRRQGLHALVGNSPPMRALYEKVRLVADTRATVLITGESGTGKELVARALHQMSPRKGKPFVPVNGGAIPETLVESELFGHENGGFTGAIERRMGLFQAARGGTLFIDEVGELPLAIQSKLLRAIEAKKVLPVGSPHEVDVDVRLIAATNRDLRELVEQQKFRDDLYDRLKVVELHLPPLRERREDIPLLVHHFQQQIAEEHSRAPCELTVEALDALMAYPWPGNVRELRNLLEGVIVLSWSERIDVGDLPEYLRACHAPPRPMRSGMTLRELEQIAIRQALEQAQGHRGEAARQLGISLRTLQRKLKEMRDQEEGQRP